MQRNTICEIAFDEQLKTALRIEKLRIHFSAYRLQFKEDLFLDSLLLLFLFKNGLLSPIYSKRCFVFFDLYHHVMYVDKFTANR